MTVPALFGRGAFRALRQGAQAKQLFLVCARALSTGSLDSAEEASAGPGSNYTNFGLSSVQQEFQEIARSFACNELLPNAARWEEEGTLPVSVLKTAAVELGVGGVYCRGEVGGSELSRMDAAVIFEALAYGDVSVTAYLTIHNMVANVIDKYGSRDLRQHYLPRIVDMSLLTSYCLTEPSSGSDAASLRTVAKRHGKEWVLTGSKCFISGGGLSDLYLVMARTGAPGPKGISAFLVEKGMKGVSFGKSERKMGWKSQPTCTVMLDEVRLPAGNLVGAEGEGFKIAMRALDGGRVNISACSVGGASYCLDTALRYASERRQFGKAISDFQNTQFRLAEMASRVQSSRLMVYNAAKALDAQHSSATLMAAMAKQHATEHCFTVANDAIQTLGGYGYLADFEVERYMRDLRVHTILEGTNDIMKLVMFRELDKLHDV